MKLHKDKDNFFLHLYSRHGTRMILDRDPELGKTADFPTLTFPRFQ